MFNKLQQLLLVSRPISWPNTAFPFGAGYLVSGGALDLTFVLGCLFFLIPYNLLMYGINDIFDYESDMKNPRKGGLEGAKEQKALHPLIWIATVVSTLPFVLFLLLTGTLVSNVVVIGVLFFVVAYSLKGLRFKEVPLLDSVTSSLHFVGPLLFALTLTDSFSAGSLYVIAFFLWGMASHAFGAVQDIVPDRGANIASIATKFGAKRTVRFALVLYVLSAAVLFMTSWPLGLIGLISPAYAANISPYCSVSDQESPMTNRGWKRFLKLNFLSGFIITMTLLFFV